MLTSRCVKLRRRLTTYQSGTTITVLVLLLVCLLTLLLLGGPLHPAWTPIEHEYAQKPIHVPYSGGGHSAKILQAENRWYRYGKPFHKMPLRHVALAFRPTRLDGQAPILYAQLMHGIFHRSQEQYIVIVLESTRISVQVEYHATRDRLADGATVHRRARIEVNQWYTLCASTYPTLDVSVVQMRTEVDHNAWSRCYSRLSSSLGGSDSTKPGILVDSGLYFGGVTDAANTNGLRNIANRSRFAGQFSAGAFINGKPVDLSQPSTIQGTPIEHWRQEFRRFDLKQSINLSPTRKSTNLTDPTFRYLPVVSAVSENHAEETHDMIASVAARMPTRGLLLYDLSLTTKSKIVLESFCNVSVRDYRKDLFRDLLGHILEYRWKPLLTLAAFQEFDGFIWADASMRFKLPVESLVLVRFGIGFVGTTEESASPVGAYTHNGTLAALGVQRSVVARSWMTIGGTHIHINGNDLSPVLLRHYVACSFEPQCVAPKGAVLSVFSCRKNERWQDHYIGCHRFDQSALSVILSKVFPGDSVSQILVNASVVADISRKPTTSFPRCIAGDKQ